MKPVDVIVTVAGRASETGGPSRPPSDVRFDWAIAVLSALFVGGLFLDGWAHTHGRVDQSFFTPWHAFFYAGYAAVALALLANLLRNHARGAAWERALPHGYGLSLVGVLIFGVGGVGDLIWHTLFGIEAGVEALLSPTHLVLALGMGLMVSGPLRAGWRGPELTSGWGGAGTEAAGAHVHPLDPHLLYGICASSGVCRGGCGSSVWGIPRAGGREYPAPDGGAHGNDPARRSIRDAATGGAYADRRAERRRHGVPHFSGGYPLALVVGAGVGGVSLDVLYAWLRPTTTRLAAWRLFAFAGPAAFYLFYFLALMSTEGIAWSVHLWVGSIVLAGIAGWLLSYLLLPPRSLEAAL